MQSSKKRLSTEEILMMKFGRLKPVKEDTERGVRRFLCDCDCGEKKLVRLSHLKGDNTKSCGCLANETRKLNPKTHGMCDNPMFNTWKSMKARCHNKNATGYQHYGGRGIKVAKEWLNDPKEFIEWINKNLGPRPSKSTLDRIDNDKGYQKGNLKWSSRRQQLTNRSSSRKVTLEGETMSVIEWVEKTGIKNSTLRARLRRGWSIEKAIKTPSGKYRKS